MEIQLDKILEKYGDQILKAEHLAYGEIYFCNSEFSVQVSVDKIYDWEIDFSRDVKLEILSRVANQIDYEPKNKSEKRFTWQS